MLNDNVWNMYVGFYGILMSFLFLEDLIENRIGFVILRGFFFSFSFMLFIVCFL